MRIGVIGAGAVGGVLAALLDRAGHEVAVTARGAHLEAIQRGGIHLSGAWGEHRAQVAADVKLTSGAELVVVATKAQDADTAIRESLAVLTGIPVVVLQNGLDGMRTASIAAPHSDIVGALATFAASLVSPGRVAVTTAGPTYLGVARGEGDVPARYAAAILSAVMPTTVVANFAGAQWTKLVINQVNALPAITGLSAQEVIGHTGLRMAMTASMREAVRVALGARVRFEAIQSLTHRRLMSFAAAPLWVGQLLPALMSRRMGATPNPGSTLQSVRRGQPSEVDYLNGAVVRAADAIGRRAPVNHRMVELVHEVEATGVFLSPTDAVDRLRAASRP